MTSHEGCNGKGGCGRAEPRIRVPLHTLEIQKALQLRWSEGIARYRGGDGSQPFKGDAIEEAYAELLDFTLYVREAMRQHVLPLPMIRDLERHARSMTTQVQRHLIARDHGGTVPAGHPGLPRNAFFEATKAEEARR
jgi:hypothetical protein